MLFDACRVHMHFGPYYSQQVALQKEHKRGTIPHSLRCDHSLPRLSASPPNEIPLISQVARRQVLALTLGVSSLTQIQPASAEEYTALKKYFTDTAGMIDELKSILEADPDAPDSQERFAAFKKNSSSWVAEYRRTSGPARPSFSNVYGVITALLGYQNQFGLGKKAFSEKIQQSQAKRLAVAEKSLEREKQKASKFLV